MRKVMVSEYKDHEDNTLAVYTEAIFLEFGSADGDTVAVIELPDGTVGLVDLDLIRFSTPSNLG